MNNNDGRTLNHKNVAYIPIIMSLFLMHKLLPVMGYYMPSVFYLALVGVVLLFFIFDLRFYRTSKKIGQIIPIFGISFLVMLMYLIEGHFSLLPTYFYGELQVFL